MEKHIRALMEIGIEIESKDLSKCFNSGFLHGVQGPDDLALGSRSESWLFGYALGLLRREFDK